MINYPLNTSGRVTLGASGSGTVKLGPTVPGVTWRLSIAAVRVSTATLEPTCNVYIGGAPIDDFFVDGTYTGSRDSTDSVAAFPILSGQSIWAVWQGGDVGAIATLSILGTYESGN